MLAIVGESGSGKSVMALTLMNLLSPTARVVQGLDIFSSDGNQAVELLGLPEKKLQQLPRKRDGHDLPGTHDLPESGDDLRSSTDGTPDTT